uniref:Uncharacterized protein n=1 Tax=Lygus hesperus TaxID=30085 RepID=A0A146KYW8_LYGHE
MDSQFEVGTLVYYIRNQYIKHLLAQTGSTLLQYLRYKFSGKPNFIQKVERMAQSSLHSPTSEWYARNSDAMENTYTPHPYLSDIGVWDGDGDDGDVDADADADADDINDLGEIDALKSTILSTTTTKTRTGGDHSAYGDAEGHAPPAKSPTVRTKLHSMWKRLRLWWWQRKCGTAFPADAPPTLLASANTAPDCSECVYTGADTSTSTCKGSSSFSTTLRSPTLHTPTRLPSHHSHTLSKL